MAKTKKGNIDTTFTDRWGNPIEIHSYLADDSGRVYFVNSHCQAVPSNDEDAPAVALSNFLKDHQVRVLSADEVLSINAKGGSSNRAGGEAGAAERRVHRAVQEAPARSPESYLPEIADKALADELRRRGYHVTAVKPAIIEL